MKLQILVVDDELHIAELLRTNLRLEGYDVIMADSGVSALHIVNSQHIDLILLDIMLPDSDGKNICRHIKSLRTDIPILMISALDQSIDRVKGLKSGADDYLGKPFVLEELLLRIKNLLSRFNKVINFDQFHIGPSLFSIEKMELSTEGETHKLSQTEVKLIRFMIENKNQTLSRQQLLDSVWGYNVYPNTRSIDNFIARLRKIIEENPNQPEFIKTIRGIGYRLELPST